ncbi:MAG: hypothetical protein K2G84_06360, partial [Muribaculaceae bacterium]|nr:hypothetical protein [Muribaculaceae bacterium]
LGMLRRMKRKMGMATGAVALSLFVALLMFSPRHRHGEITEMASTVVTLPAVTSLSSPDPVAETRDVPGLDGSFRPEAAPIGYSGLEAEHDAIVKGLLAELKLAADSMAILAADESLPRNIRSRGIGVCVEGMNSRISSAFDSLRARCPDDYLSRQKPGWATVFDPALSAHQKRVEGILRDFSNRADSI